MAKEAGRVTAEQVAWVSSRAMAAKDQAKAAQVAKEANQAKAAHQAKEAGSQGAVSSPTSNWVDPLQNLAPFQRLEHCLGWWQENAPQFVLNLITQGVEPKYPQVNLPLKAQEKSQEEKQLALKVMMEYVEAKAAQEVPLEGTRYLVPWFVIQKWSPLEKKS